MAERELTLGGRRLSQLKVDELKAELEKRGLKKSGNKGILIERLQEALDKELEMNESYEGFSVPPPSQLKAATLQAANSMMLAQSGGHALQPTGEQQPLMLRQHQSSSVEDRKSRLQPELPTPQMIHHQAQQEQQPRSPDQQPSQFNSGVLTQSSYPQSGIQRPVAPGAGSSSSSSDGEQKPDEQSSSSSERDRDSDEQQHDTDQNRESAISPLNQSTTYRTEKNSSLLPDKENRHLSEDTESGVNRASNVEKESQSEPGGENRKEEYAHSEEEDKENLRDPNQPSSLVEDNTFEVEPSEEDKAVVDEPKAPLAPKPTSPVLTKKRKISIPRTSVPSTPTSDGQPGSRKRRWGSSSSSKKKTSLSISTDSLKVLIPGVQLHSTPALEAVMDLGEDDNDDDNEEEEKKAEPKGQEETAQKHGHVQMPEKNHGRKKRDRIVKVEEKKTFKLQRKTLFVESAPEEQKTEVVEEPVLQVTGNPHTRQTSLSGKETSPVPADRSPSPARNPKSKALHVKSLVRPFTLNQLKELLGKYGSLTDNGFWIDKIKSHCYVVYKSAEDAAASRQALHGVKWPLTSPKILSVDFADEDEMARDTEGALGNTKVKEKEIKAEEVVKKKEARMVEEDEDDQKNPGNLLDNLFRKTKTTPCLYWLPLSDEQIATREKEREERRKQRQDERKKEEEDRKERQQQRERERQKEKEKRERETDKPRSRSPRDRRRERSRSRSRGPRRR